MHQNNNLVDSESFKSTIKITGNTPANGNIEDVEIIVLSKYLSNYWRPLEMPLINSEVNLILTWSSTCVITNSTSAEIFAITDTRLYVPVTTLSTQDNTKLLQKLKCGFKRTTNWNKCQSDPKIYAQNRYFNHLVDPIFYGMNRLFVLSFENEDDRRSHSGCYLPKVEMKDCKILIDGKSFFDQPINNVTKHMKILDKLFLGKEMITQLLVC